MKNKTLHVDLGGISYWPNEAITGIPRVTLSLAKAISHLGDYRNTRLNLISLLDDDHKVPGSVLDKFELAGVCQDLSSAGGVIFLLDIYYYKYKIYYCLFHIILVYNLQMYMLANLLILSYFIFVKFINHFSMELY